jgi:hypothetical protein
VKQSVSRVPYALKWEQQERERKKIRKREGVQSHFNRKKAKNVLGGAHLQLLCDPLVTAHFKNHWYM